MLSSLKSTATMPKTELNAVTLAMRIANAAIMQLESVVNAAQTVVLSDFEFRHEMKLEKSCTEELTLQQLQHKQEIDRLEDEIERQKRKVVKLREQ
ncbi:unnamed protein product [Cylicostephanus goldi]|uniref:Uncharacterized protein n=1 Tax=Cylicostephanus goldi TaxID=71465 RepID=A0A3P7N9Z4_CYLGO|nr:unnamed protein product [Cylicostephanus goldi]